jgi:hypothetical protein
LIDHRGSVQDGNGRLVNSDQFSSLGRDAFLSIFFPTG